MLFALILCCLNGLSVTFFDYLDCLDVQDLLVSGYFLGWGCTWVCRFVMVFLLLLCDWRLLLHLFVLHVGWVFACVGLRGIFFGVVWDY